MEPHVAPKSMPTSSPSLPTNHTGIFSLVVGSTRKKPAQVTPENDRPAAQDWIPENDYHDVHGQYVASHDTI
ncbi:hypothetical protein DSO57_1008302 [Entomophthora muscae]|uniref:Uncharacterized protein n=1 Tax=Entomophthora muscae TaxID=34485 RepID=A0ACC2UT26_9FUNG|nr:hypothetical protein DSO57_1008302 [Entomophthora muscae]